MYWDPQLSNCQHRRLGGPNPAAIFILTKSNKANKDQ